MQIKKVLMVDDDPSIRKVANLSLTRVGKWEVVLASSGAEALEMLPTSNPDVILLDIMMPGMDGPTTLSRLREECPEFTNTPVIFMTAKVLRHEIESYSKLGALGVIIKPFDPLTLPKEIITMVGGTPE
jgi:CheY-like chemotaxis protein